MDVDPVDECTFWYTTMYVGVPGIELADGGSSFRLHGSVFGDVEGSVTDGANALSAVVESGGGGGGNEHVLGHYTFAIPAGTYSLTATKYADFPSTVDNVVVTAGGDTMQNFTLDGGAAGDRHRKRAGRLGRELASLREDRDHDRARTDPHRLHRRPGTIPSRSSRPRPTRSTRGPSRAVIRARSPPPLSAPPRTSRCAKSAVVPI